MPISEGVLHAGNVIVSIRGHFFRGDAMEVIATIGENSVREVAERGHARLDAILRPRPAGVFLSEAQAGPRVSKGNYRRHVHHQVDSLHGFIGDGGVVYGPWLEGVGSRNETTRFKGYASFRRTGEWMKTIVPSVTRSWAERVLRDINQ